MGKQRLLITGASGFLGWHLCELAAPTWQVIGVCRAHPIHVDSVEHVSTDLSNPLQIKRLFDDTKPDAVVHAAAASDPNFCQQNPDESRKINVEAPAAIAALCADLGLPLAVLSSDLVFDGRNSPYAEDDPVNPVNQYGEHKAAAEEMVRSRHPGALVCRMPLMFGFTGSNLKAFDDQIIRAIRGNERIDLFVDEFRTPVDARSAARGILQFLDKKSGFLHLGGRERLSRYEMGVRIARHMGVDNAGIVPIHQNERPMPAARPPDVSLDSAKAFALGYAPLNFREAINERVQGVE